ncbi:hypothetical protein [Sporomusa silvacetica]|uniref:hypothetical protein n=1 Tax=Sporomusa silvacetica TaxID=55504 RepID=UPI001B7FFD00|nr:hypothetical protein [Sporomusa silvacetica]
MLYQGVLINVGVLGPVQGAILIGMDIDSAKQFASQMMIGMEVTEFDGLAQSAISGDGKYGVCQCLHQFCKVWY